MNSSKKKFIEQGRKKMIGFVETSINQMIDILNSPIIYPTDLNGDVQEHKILAVVKSREQVYTSTINMIELIEIGNEKFLEKIITGMKNTWHELTNIVTREIRQNQFSRERDVEDNHLASIAQAKELASKVAYNILERIELLEMTEEEQEQKIKNNQFQNVIERYAQD